MKKYIGMNFRFIAIALTYLLGALLFSMHIESGRFDSFILRYAVFFSLLFATLMLFNMLDCRVDLQRAMIANLRRSVIDKISRFDDPHTRALNPSSHPHLHSDDVESSADRLFDNWSQFHAAGQSGRGQRAFVIGCANHSNIRILKNILLADGFDVDICNDIDTVTESIISSPKNWSLLVVDWDMLRYDLTGEDAVDILFYFRRFINHIPTILVSSEFSCDDFGTERISLSDVSVRSPVSPERFKLAVKTANVNNDLFRRIQEGRLRQTSTHLKAARDDGID